MKTVKLVDQTDVVMPVIAALPYSIVLEDNELMEEGNYNPELQLTTNMGRDYSTSSSDDSAGGIFSSKRDTKKDD